MDILKHRSPARKRIGELLVDAGIIKAERIPEALKVVRQSGLPLGRVLIMLGALKEPDLDNALLVQSMLRDGRLPADGDLAIKALKMSFQRRGTLAEALAALGWKEPSESLPISQLGELLVAVGAITRAQLDEAGRKTAQSGMPIGRYLILQGGISPSTLAAGLTAQVYLRDGRITWDQAVHGLKLALLKRASLDQALAYQGVIDQPKPEAIRLGELLGQAAVVMECDTLTAVEIGLKREEPMGRILVEAGIVSAPALDAALRLQELVKCGALSPLQAIDILKQVHARGLTVDQVLADSGLMRKQEEETEEAVELMRNSGLLSAVQIEQVRSAARTRSAGLRSALLASKLVEPSLVESACKCNALMKEGLLRLEQAIIALNYCQRSRISLEDAFEELVWDIPVGRNPG